MKRLRYWLAIAGALLLAYATLAYAQYADAESACRDQAAISGSAEP